MYAILYASAAALFAARAAAVGKTTVVNGCSYPVYMLNTPSDDGVHKQISNTIQPGSSYSQEYVELTNKAGWAIKLSKDGKTFSSNIMQYEYTFQGDGSVWYDLSGVDGNPWNGDWLLQAQKGKIWGGSVDASKGNAACKPTQQYYRCPTDNANGMQTQCTDDVEVTFNLCAAESTNTDIISSLLEVAKSAAASPAPCAYTDVPSIGVNVGKATSVVANAISSAAAIVKNPGVQAPAASSPTTTPTPTPSPAAPSPSSHTSSTTVAPPANHDQHKAEQPTTFVTSKTAAVLNQDAHVVTEVVTFVTTAQATQTVWARHEHHHNHEH